MFVNKVKIRYDKIGTGVTINIPIDLTFTPIDNSELIEDKFVEKEVEKSINPITDYKKVRFKPAKVVSGNWVVVPEFKIQNVFIKGGTYTTAPSSYGDIGFTYDDLFCRTNRVLFSYMTLSFFDTPITNSNRLLFFNTIFTQIQEDQKEETGQVKIAEEAPISFIIGDPILKPSTDHEGFHLYWYKDLVDGAPNKEYVMYMSVTYNNANYGYTTPMYTLPTSDLDNVEIQDVNGPNGGLFLKVILKYDETDNIYKYTFVKETNQVGVDWNNVGTPTITLYQISGEEY